MQRKNFNENHKLFTTRARLIKVKFTTTSRKLAREVTENKRTKLRIYVSMYIKKHECLLGWDYGGEVISAFFWP